MGTSVLFVGGRFVVYRIGDAIANHNIHAATLDAYWLCNAI